MSRSNLPLSHSPRSLFSILLILTAAGTAGCKTEHEISVRVSIPGPDSLETPAAGVGVIALPYDRDSVLKSLEARARTPRPPTAALDSQFARFRGPFTTYSRLSYAAAELRESLDVARKRLDSTPEAAPGYGTMSTRVRKMSDSLMKLDAQSRRAHLALDRARTEFVNRSESLRTAVRQWEDSTYRGYDSIVENLTKARGREAVTDTTGATGWAELVLNPGSWWLYARAWDTSDPNAEWYWNVPVEGDTILLSSRTGKRRAKY